MLKLLRLVAALPLFFASMACADTLTDMAKAVASEACDFRVYPGGTPNTIFVLEELHNSFTTNLQEAVALVRLHNKFGLRTVGLEGFFVGEAFRRSHPASRDRALAAIKAGDINSAEFLYLAYDDVTVYPIEKSEDWVKPPPGVDLAVSKYLAAIAQKTFQDKVQKGQISPEDVEKVGQLIRRNDPQALREFLISIDPFVGTFLNTLQNMKPSDAIGSHEQIKLFKSLIDRARAVGADVGSAASTLAAYVTLLEKRGTASSTMASIVGSLADKSSIAIIIGAAHTNDMVKVFNQQHRSTVVLSCTASKSSAQETEYTDQEMQRKYDRVAIGADAIDSALRDVFGGRVKPRPGLGTPSYEAKAELYAKVDDLVRILFRKPLCSNCPPTRPGGDGNGKPPPTDWSRTLTDSPEFRQILLALPDERYRGKYIRIDKTKIELAKDLDGNALLFPVTIMGDDKKTEKTLWIKAGLSKAAADTADNTEQELLAQIRKKREPSKEGEKVDISAMTAMLAAPAREDAVQKMIYSR
jgi:hypothetical protein